MRSLNTSASLKPPNALLTPYQFMINRRGNKRLTRLRWITVAAVQERNLHAGLISVLAYAKLPPIVRGRTAIAELILIFRIYFFRANCSAHSPFFSPFFFLFFFTDLADDPSHSFDAGGGETTTCDAFLSSRGFTNTPQCSTTGPISQDNQYTWKQWTNLVAGNTGCCGDEKKSACWEDISAGVCKTASDCTWDNCRC